MELTREEALKLHREMWTDMLRDVGENPSLGERVNYKLEWCVKRFPDVYILNNCFLCEYDSQLDDFDCKLCPIDWGMDGEKMGDCEKGPNKYYEIPISQLLALPEKEV